MHRIRPLLLVLTATAFLLPATASAQSATRFLEERHETVNRILRENAGAGRTERLRGVLGDLLDYEALSRAALGDHWDEQDAEQQRVFVDLLRQLVRRNYEANLERILDYEVTYGEERQDDGRTVVPTRARSRTERRQPPVEIVYTLRRAGPGWRVVDVRTDGVSMVRNYRRQFGRIIARSGWDGLLERMRRRLADGDDGD